MHANKTQTAVRRVTKGILKANRVRNAFTILAIVLTTFMLSSVFSLGVNFAQNFSQTMLRQAGTKASIFLPNATETQYETMKNLTYLKDVGRQISIGSVAQKTADNKETKIALEYYDAVEWEKHYTPAITDINGSYPADADEIMLSRSALEQLGVTSPSIGQAIPLHYTDPNGGHTATFRLSGWFTSYGTDNVGRAFLSEAFCRQNNLTVAQHGTASISTGNVHDVLDSLKQDVPTTQGQEFKNRLGAQSSISDTIQVAAIVALLALFLVMSGYLLIYNVFYISVTKDIQQYGLLKTIGASPSQIRSIVRRQALLLAAIGIPIGLALGALVSVVLVPYAISTVSDDSAGRVATSFSPVIFVGAALFSLLTVIVSARKPAKIAGHISPVEAVRYSATKQSGKQKKRNSTSGGKLHKMALRNIFRDKKRAVLVFLSLFLGAVTLLSVNGVLGSMDSENYGKRYIRHDFSLTNMAPITHEFDSTFVEALQKMEGLTHFELMRSSSVKIAFDAVGLAPLLRSGFESMGSDTSEAAYQTFLNTIRELAEKGEYGTWVQSLDARYIDRYNQTHEEKIDAAAFARGDIVLTLGGILTTGQDWIGVPMTLTGRESGKTASTKIGGILSSADVDSFLNTGGTMAGEPMLLFASDAFLQKLDDNPIVTSILMDVDQKHEPAAKAQVQRLVESLPAFSGNVTVRSDALASFAQDMTTLTVIGSGVSLLLLLIGILNFANVMLTGVFSRRNEFAVLESIGMTKKQISRMLVLEGLYYAAITTGLILTIGNGVLFGLGQMVPSIADYAVFRYPVGLLVALLGLIGLLCAAIPPLAYRSVAKNTVTERLRSTEN